MRKPTIFIILAVLACAALWAQKSKDLEVYFIDVEGGQATLFVSPSGESMEVDTGWAGTRDADRIAGIAKLAGVREIDYLVLTHYHGDHAGGVVDLASRIPIRNFVDHGPNVALPRIMRPICRFATKGNTFWPPPVKNFP